MSKSGIKFRTTLEDKKTPMNLEAFKIHLNCAIEALIRHEMNKDRKIGSVDIQIIPEDGAIKLYYDPDEPRQYTPEYSITFPAIGKLTATKGEKTND